MLIVEHAVGNIIVYAYAGAVEIAESIDKGVEGKWTCVRGVEHIAAELKVVVPYAELCKKRGCQVGLAGYLVHHYWLGHSSSGPNHRYTEEVRGKSLALLWIWNAVVGQQYDEGVGPLWCFAESLYKASYAVVGIGEGIEMVVLELTERHLKRLMTA